MTLCRKCGQDFTPRPRGLTKRSLCDDCTKYRPVEAGRLLVTCWCEGDEVYVLPHDIQQGLTGSCKKKECRDMDARMRGR